MATINDFIDHYCLQRYKNYFQDLSNDLLVRNKIAPFDKEEFDRRVNFFKNDLDRILDKLETPPTEENKKDIIRGVLCAEDCWYVAHMLPEDFIYKLKKEWTVETILAVLVRSKKAQADLEKIFHQVRYYTRIPYNPALVGFFLSFKDDKLDYLAKCLDLRNTSNSFEYLKQRTQATIEGQPLCEWYEGELSKAKEHHDASIITKLLTSQAFQDYCLLEYKKPAPTVVEFVIIHDFDELINRVIGASPQKLSLALTTAIQNNKANTVKTLCAMGAIKVAKDTLSDAAFAAKNIEIFDILLKAGADVDEGNFASHLVFEIYNSSYSSEVNKTYQDMLVLLLNTHKSQQLGYSLEHMVRDNEPALVRLLIQYGALAQLDTNNQPLLTLALEKDALEVVSLLLTAGQFLDEKSIDTYDPKGRHYLSPGSDEYKDHEAELPLIRASLREALKILSTKPASSVNSLRDTMKEIFDAKQNEQANTNHSLHTAFTFLTSYKSKKTWGTQNNSMGPLKWKEGDDAAKLSELIKKLIGHPVKIFSKDNYSDQIQTNEGLLRWFGPEDTKSGLVSVAGYSFGIYIRDIRELTVSAENTLQSGPRL